MGIYELMSLKMTENTFNDAVDVINVFLRQNGYNLRFGPYFQDKTCVTPFKVCIRYIVDDNNEQTFYFNTKRAAIEFCVTMTLDWVISLSK